MKGKKGVDHKKKLEEGRSKIRTIFGSEKKRKGKGAS